MNKEGHDVEVLSPWRVKCKGCKQVFHIHCRWDRDKCDGKALNPNLRCRPMGGRVMMRP